MTLRRSVLHTELGNFELIRHGTKFLEKKTFGATIGPGSPNPDPISDKKMSFSTPVFRPDL